MNRQRVSGQHRIDPAAANQLRQRRHRRLCAPPPGPRPRQSSFPPSRACRISAAVCRTAVSTCRSDEISLLMNANASRSRSFDFGHDPDAFIPTTTAIARLDIAQSAAIRARPSAHNDHRVHALVLALRSIARDGGRACADWWWSRNLPARSGRTPHGFSSASPESTGEQPRPATATASSPSARACGASTRRRS